MSQSSALALLSAARNLLADIPSWRLPTSQRTEVQLMLSKMDQLLQTVGVVEVEAQHTVVPTVRWNGITGIRPDEGAICCADAKGLWISAWVLLHSADRSPTIEQFEDALALLPVMAREIYRLHRIEGLSLRDAGRLLGLASEEAEKQLSNALRDLHRLLY